MQLRGLGFGALLISLTAASVASANGRFPRAQRLQIDPKDPNHMMVFATYGLVKTTDGGQSWWHICEGATGQYNGEGALFDFMSDESYLAGANSSLTRSKDKGCDWTITLPPRDNAVPEDFAVDPADRSKALAIVNVSLPMFEYDFELQETTDNGQTWNVINTEIPTSYLYTLDFAASDPTRLYLSGWNTVATDAGVTQTPIFLRSNTRGLGADWTVTEFGAATGELPFIVKVAPDDADKVFVRTSHDTEEEDLQVPLDGLFYSKDGGATWKDVLRARARLFGFALSPDGKTVLAGYGNQRWPGWVEDEKAFGLYKASVADLEAGNAFTRIYDKPVSCITWTADALYVCTSQTDAMLEIGKAPNAEFTLDTPNPLEPILKLPCVNGPLDCPADTAGGKCPTDMDAGWPSVCPLIGVDCAADKSVCSGGTGGADGGAGGDDGGAGGADSGAGGDDGGSAGTGATGATGATGGTDGTGATGGTGGAGSTGAGGNAAGGSDDDGGCALSAPKGSQTRNFGAFALGLVLWRSLQRRRRAQ